MNDRVAIGGLSVAKCLQDLVEEEIARVPG